MIYKIVLDIMDRYLADFDGPLFKTYRTKLIPFATMFYNKLNKKSVEFLKEHLQYFKPYYNSKSITDKNCIEFVICESKEEYLDYYENKKIEYDNMCRDTHQEDCYTL